MINLFFILRKLFITIVNFFYDMSKFFTLKDTACATIFVIKSFFTHKETSFSLQKIFILWSFLLTSSFVELKFGYEVFAFLIGLLFFVLQIYTWIYLSKFFLLIFSRKSLCVGLFLLRVGGATPLLTSSFVELKPGFKVFAFSVYFSLFPRSIHGSIYRNLFY